MTVTGQIISDTKIRFKLEFELGSGEFEALQVLTHNATTVGNCLWIAPCNARTNLRGVLNDMKTALEKIKQERNTA